MSHDEKGVQTGRVGILESLFTSQRILWGVFRRFPMHSRSVGAVLRAEIGLPLLFGS
jgi:hypothetical protein